MASVPLRDRMIAAARRTVPRSVRDWVVTTQRRFGLQWPRVGHVEFGDLRRLSPVSPVFALDRGFPIERYYIEHFLEKHRNDIRGTALEFGDTQYLDKFGGSAVSAREVFSYVPANSATIVGDLTGDSPLPEGRYDVIVCTQTIQMIYDIRLAVRRLASMLRPGGVLLLTTHGISKVGRHLDRDGWGEYWHLTRQAAQSLFTDAFPGRFTIDAYGNVLSATAALHGLASGELSNEELHYSDRDFDVIIGVRAVREGEVRS
jgi:SAM-dependent methyltransferase